MRRSAVVTLLGVAVVLWPLAIEAQQNAQRLADQVIRRLNLQTTFPNATPEPPPFQIKLPAEALWIIVIIAFCVLLYALRDVIIPLFGLNQRGDWSDEGTAAGDSKLRASAATLTAADDLAAHGNFVEAMHALLLQGLAIMRERLSEQYADSLTSREILSSAKLPQDGRNSLHDIVTRVEWTYFGERPATRNDYDACRTSFTALTQALHRGSAA